MTTTDLTALEQELPNATIAEIAAVIAGDWTNVNYAAVPYLDAMFSLTTIRDKYGMDDGKGIVIYFLSNAGTWRGNVAKLVKAELKRRVK